MEIAVAIPKVAPVGPRPALVPDETPFKPVPVTDVPEERFKQLVGFFQRNPGMMKTSGMVDAVRGAATKLPKVGGLILDLTETADVGFGQAIRDQTRWQITTRRQPDNSWWLRMNRQLVEDPLTAERAVRTGTVDQLQTSAQKAWAEYVRRSDLVMNAMGVTPEEAASRARTDPVAISDTYKGVGLLKRAYVEMVLKPYARKALWVAHRKTLECARPMAAEQAAEMHRTAPKEMEFGSGWATFIGYWSMLSPPVTGNLSKLAQGVILPMQHPIDPSTGPWTMRAFAKLIDWLDPIYERDIATPTDAADAAATAAAATAPAAA